MTNSKPYAILTGVGDLFIAPVGTAFPVVDAVPGVAWRALGYTQEGVTVKKSSKIEKVLVDQDTGPVKASRSEEGLTVETQLAEATLENLADYLGNTVTDTPAAAGVAGTRSVGLYSGAFVKTFALLFRGISTYGNLPSQYQVPVCYFDGDTEMKHQKGGKNATIKAAFEALVNPDAVTDTEKFGNLIHQDAAALP